jgi:hypothetical protein
MNYRFTIIEAIDLINKINKELFEKLANVAMAGEFSDAAELFNENENIPVVTDQFDNCKDVNVRLIAALMKTSNQIKGHIIRINNIKDDELGITVEY